MDKVARLPASERRELFRETATRRGMSPAVIEKDFWVCWVLKHLFAEPELKDRVVFKGGATLSKVFGLIDRFSEDIDLVLDWRLLGYGTGIEDPYQDFDSISNRDRFNKAVNQKAAQYIAGTLVHDLNRLVTRCPQVVAPWMPTTRTRSTSSTQPPFPRTISIRRCCWRSDRSPRGCPRPVTPSNPTPRRSSPRCSSSLLARWLLSARNAPSGRKRRFCTNSSSGGTSSSSSGGGGGSDFPHEPWLLEWWRSREGLHSR